MSYEVWGDGDDGHDNCRTDEHVRESFITGAQAMREMLARFVEQGGDHSTAASIRANWSPSWGPDPGRLTGTLPTPGDDPPIAPRPETAMARVAWDVTVDKNDYATRVCLVVDGYEVCFCSEKPTEYDRECADLLAAEMRKQLNTLLRSAGT